MVSALALRANGRLVVIIWNKRGSMQGQLGIGEIPPLVQAGGLAGHWAVVATAAAVDDMAVIIGMGCSVGAEDENVMEGIGCKVGTVEDIAGLAVVVVVVAVVVVVDVLAMVIADDGIGWKVETELIVDVEIGTKLITG